MIRKTSRKLLKHILFLFKNTFSTVQLQKESETFEKEKIEVDQVELNKTCPKHN